MDGQHRRFGVGSGFILGGNLIVSTYENIESANSVRVTTTNGITGELNGLVAWNRREDWAVMRFPAPLSNPLAVAKAESWQIGDMCYSLDSPQEGNRTIVSGNITGRHKFPEVGERWNLNFHLSERAGGSPVVTEYGEVIGIASSASLVPGLGSLAVSKQGDFPEFPSNLAGQGLTPGFGAQLVLPMSTIKLPQPETAVTTFAEMMKSGQFLENLVKNENLLMGSMGKSLEASQSIDVNQGSEV